MKNLCTLFLLFIAFSLQAQRRKAWMGANGKASAYGLAVDTVIRGSTLDKIGIKKYDTLQIINTTIITGISLYNKATDSIRENDLVKAVYKRGFKILKGQAKAISKPLETSDFADISYDWVTYEECLLRAITRIPKGKSNVPAVLLIPGYNCGSIENFSSGIYRGLINDWLRSGYAVVTIEKSGLGDSYNCKPCSEADLVTDIQTFDAGYRYMENRQRIDKNNLFIWGHSMGGVVAPEIAKLHQPKGVIVYATVFRPWSEFLLEMHRMQAPLDGKSYVETEAYVRKLQKVYYEFFRLKRSPAELYNNPEYKDIVASELEYKAGSNNMWGRHWRFWQQIDSLDLAASWSAVNCPVYSVFGGADYIACSELEHHLLVNTVNSIHPGNATHRHIEDIDHLLVQNKDRKDAHKNFADKAYRDTHIHPDFSHIIIEWMDKVKMQ